MPVLAQHREDPAMKYKRVKIGGVARWAECLSGHEVQRSGEDAITRVRDKIVSQAGPEAMRARVSKGATG